MCGRIGCERPTSWQPVLYVPIARSAERDFVSVVLPITFCDQHRLSDSAASKLERSSRFQQALAHRIGGGWAPDMRKSWIRRTRIESDRESGAHGRSALN
jgi:hypothetical protein